MKQSLIPIFLILSILLGCSKVKEKAKETINKSGETVGKSASEFFEGVSEGIDKTLECELILSEELKNKGLQTGKFTIESASGNGNKNVLTAYLIFENDLEGTIMAKAFDKNGLEIGRTKIEVSNQKDEAGYFDFTFDERTHIEVKSRIVLE